MKALTTAVALSLAFSAQATAKNITQDNVEKAQAVIAQVIEAYGGAESLNELKTLRVKADTVNYAVNQSRKPEPPWDKNSGTVFNAIDLENSIFVSRNSGDGGGFEFDGGQIINAPSSASRSHRSWPPPCPDRQWSSRPRTRRCSTPSAWVSPRASRT